MRPLTEEKLLKTATSLALPGLLMVCTILLTSCVSWSDATSGVITVNDEDMNTQNSVLAIQLSAQSFEYSSDTNRGYLMLLDSEGKGTALEVGLIHGAQPLWRDEGLYFGGTDDEFVVDDSGLTRIPRNSESHFELARYPQSEKSGFISFYNSGAEAGTYFQKFTVGDISGVRDINVPGVYMSFGKCGDTIYGITSTRLSSNLTEAAALVSQDPRAAKQDHDALVRLYPGEDRLDPEVLISVRADESFQAGSREVRCVGSSVYQPGFLLDNPNARKGDGKDPKAGHVAFRVWDMEAGTASILDLVDDEGAFIEVSGDELHGPSVGHLEGTAYRFVTGSGKVFSADLSTGVTTHEFTIPPSPDDASQSIYRVGKEHVYVLHAGNGGNSPPPSLLRYQIPSGEEEHLITLSDISRYFHNGVLIQGMAINPEFMKQ